MQFKRIKRRVDGVLLLDKPAGLSSNQALQQVKRLYMAAKAGHTGTLDPFATGLLPICLGEATKFSHFLLDADKTYRATLKFGATSTTGDTEGEIVAAAEMDVTREMVESALHQFVGEICQIPPMYSALKHQGKALYEYARAGVEIERQPRAVTIYKLMADEFKGSSTVIMVSCSKGTYIRTLAEDIGKAIGCGAYLTQLCRIETGGFDLSQAVTMEMLESMTLEQRDMRLLPADILVQQFPEVTLDADSAYYLCRGQSVWKSGALPPGVLRLYAEPSRFLGLGEVDADGKIAPRRLVVS
ncbi:tRNA pseudouridine synthase B [mine drainage metagenome]|uniref:tRNA pseudouridine(55) synthase n=1 Tax=mine drainage metagenome TaxID=410659 RepID=A0A1J5QMV1_9ZZZZ